MFRIRSALLLAAAAVALLTIPAVSAAQQNALAIFNLTPTNMEAMGYDGEILYALLSAMEREKSIELMPRREMEEILFQAGLVQGGDTESIAQAGKVLGINFILFGNVTKKGSRIHSQLKLMDVQNRRVIKTWLKDFSGREAIISEIPDFARELSSSILNREQSQAAAPAAAPAVPTVDIENLKAESRGEKVMLSWRFDPSEPIAAFNVYRSENAEGPYQYHGKTDRNRFEDARVRKGGSYYYRVGILLSSGREVKSNLTAQVKSAGERVPHPPLVLEAGGHVRRTHIKFVPSLLNDQENFEIKEYMVYRRKTDQNSWESLASVKAVMQSQFELAFTFEDAKGLDDGETYVYAISSLDREGRESQQSDPVTVKTIDRPVLRVEKDGLLRKMKLAWELRENVDGYYLYRRSRQEEWQKIAKVREGSKSEHVDDEGLEDGQTYEYYLTNYDAKGESGPSKPVTGKTKNVPPHPKDVMAQSGLVKSVKLFWTPVDDPDVGGYTIYRGTSPGNLEKIDKVKGYASHSYLDDGPGFSPLDDGRDYYYAIVSFNLFGADGEPTETIKATTKPRPATVRGIKAVKGADSIQISWQKNPEPDIKTYIVERNRNQGFWTGINRLGPDETGFSDTDLKPEAEYRYRVTAEDGDGLKSDPVESEAISSPIAKP